MLLHSVKEQYTEFSGYLKEKKERGTEHET